MYKTITIFLQTYFYSKLIKTELLDNKTRSLHIFISLLQVFLWLLVVILTEESQYFPRNKKHVLKSKKKNFLKQQTVYYATSFRRQGWYSDIWKKWPQGLGEGNRRGTARWTDDVQARHRAKMNRKEWWVNQQQPPLHLRQRQQP